MTKLDDFANACWDFMATIGYAVEAAFDTVTHWISLPLRRLGLIQLPEGPLNNTESRAEFARRAENLVREMTTKDPAS